MVVVFQLRPSLYGSIKTSCDSGDEYHLLHEVLQRELSLLRQRLDDANFGAFILKIWNALIAIFSKIVEISCVVSNHLSLKSFKFMGENFVRILF